MNIETTDNNDIWWDNLPDTTKVKILESVKQSNCKNLISHEDIMKKFASSHFSPIKIK